MPKIVEYRIGSKQEPGTIAVGLVEMLGHVLLQVSGGDPVIVTEQRAFDTDTFDKAECRGRTFIFNESGIQITSPPITSHNGTDEEPLPQPPTDNE